MVAIPPAVLQRVAKAVADLQELHRDLHDQRRAASGPEWWENGNKDAVAQRINGIERFLEAAKLKGVDGDALIAKLGGVPDFTDRSPITVAPPRHGAPKASMKDYEAAGHAVAARAWNKARHNSRKPWPSAVEGIGAYGHATSQVFSDADHDAIVRHWDSQERAASRAAEPPRGLGL